jgi:ribosomal 50S subunit-recycling heat shock protein
MDTEMPAPADDQPVRPDATASDPIPPEDQPSLAAELAGATEDADEDLRHFRWKVTKNLTRRLDQYLVDRVGYLSRNGVQKLIGEGLVKINGRVAKASAHPRDGDVVEMVAPPEPVSELVPEPIPLDVVYEDDHILAINKQPNLMVHPARGKWTGTLVNGLVYYGKKWSQLNGDWRPGISTGSTRTRPASCSWPRATRPTGGSPGSSRTGRSRRRTWPSATASRRCSAT